LSQHAPASLVPAGTKMAVEPTARPVTSGSGRVEQTGMENK
jgi:hypothetical protein